MSGAQRRRGRHVVVGVLVAVLVLTGCTGESDREPGAEQQDVVGSGEALGPKAAPLEVEITSVAGKIPRKQRAQIRKRVAATVGGYLEGAFLGDYPRTTYRAAFENFTDPARSRARRDRGLLTHADRGARYVGVTPRRLQVRVNAFAPRRRVLGGTARIHLVMLVERDDDTVQRVRVTGRLLLTRANRGDFRIFGYDVRRDSSRPAAGGGS